jgi:hypothetical protein
MKRDVPCGNLIESGPAGQAPACERGWDFPSACRECADYTPGLNAQERQRCEIWTRVMGYHRPVSQWNAGKQQEHAQRLYLREPKDDHDA